MEPESLLRSHQLLNYWRIYHFMEPENSLSRSKEPAISPYPEPD
jgi:hypothetical protein